MEINALEIAGFFAVAVAGIVIDTTCSQCGARNVSVRPVFRGLEIMCQHCRHTVTHELLRGTDPAQMLELMKQITDEGE